MDDIQPTAGRPAPDPTEKPIVIYGGPLYDGQDTVYQEGCLYIEDGKIALIGNEEDVYPDIPREVDAELLDARGRVIFPGLINLHHHLANAFTTGLAPHAPVKHFQDRLTHFIWKYDVAHNKESIQMAALLSLLDSVRYGVTTVFDQHSSPRDIENSLEVIAAVIEKMGISGVLGYEISDREEKRYRHQAITENQRFIEKYQNNPRIRGLLGLHANFTLDEESMALIADLFEPDIGLHIHWGEASLDKAYCEELGYQGCLDRLAHFGLLTPKTILAHGVHQSKGDLARLEKSQAILVHNPESNANSGVGQLNLPLSDKLTIGLGSDGLAASLLHVLRAAFLSHRQAGISSDLLYQKLPGFLFQNNARAAGRFLPGAPGILEKGARADVAIFDYIPATPFHSQNLSKHLINGMYNARATTVLAAGKPILKEGLFLTVDEQLIREEARQISHQMWERYVK